MFDPRAVIFAIIASTMCIFSDVDATLPILSMPDNLTSLTESHSPTSFIRLYNEYRHVCSTFNIILQRHEGINLNESLKYSRDWSLNAGLVHDFLDIHQHNHTARNSRPLCKSAEEVSYSMSLSVKDHPCTISWFDPATICHVLDKFSLVVIFGDSLTRHFIQTLMMLLRSDFRFGGIPLHQGNELYENCGCDGQFSGAVMCRKPWGSDILMYDID